MAKVRYEPDYKGTGQIMTSQQMRQLVGSTGERAKELAEAISPVGSTERGDSHPGLYKASFSVETGTYHDPKGDRAQAVLVNTSDHAADVEWRDGFLVLTRVLGALEHL